MQKSIQFALFIGPHTQMNRYKRVPDFARWRFPDWIFGDFYVFDPGLSDENTFVQKVVSFIEGFARKLHAQSAAIFSPSFPPWSQPRSKLERGGNCKSAIAFAKLCACAKEQRAKCERGSARRTTERWRWRNKAKMKFCLRFVYVLFTFCLRFF